MSIPPALRFGGAALLLLDAAAAQTGQLRGRVLDAAGLPVEAAAVFVCAQDSGLPLMAKTRAPIDTAAVQDGQGPLHATTDGRGRFDLGELPAGSYRLVAQSWREVAAPRHAFEVNGPVVVLRGLAEGVAVAAGERTEVTLRPAGTGSLEIEVGVGNDDTLCVVSSWPPGADPILGFAGWGGKFLRNAIAANRMPDGKTTFTGLPAGKLFFALFANDNNPGFGAGDAEVRVGKATKCRVSLVADWSDARHEPPASLAPLVERLRGLGEVRGVVAAVCKRLDIDLSQARGPFDHWRLLAEHLDRRAELADGTEVRFGDLCAAAAYLQLAERRRRRR